MDAYVLDSDSECNWMKFARFSLNGKANLEIVQKDNLLYFVSTNPIEEGEELLVGLSLQRSLTLETFFDSLWNNWAQTLPGTSDFRFDDQPNQLIDQSVSPAV